MTTPADPSTAIERLIAEIQARAEKASPPPWRSMSAGNGEMENGRLAAIAEVEGLPRPWSPVWVGWNVAKNYFKTFMRQEDADFVGHARADIPRLLATLAAETQARQEAETEHAHAIGIAEIRIGNLKLDIEAERHRSDAFERELTAEREARQALHAETGEAAQNIMLELVPLVADAAIVGRTYGWPQVLGIVMRVKSELLKQREARQQAEKAVEEWRAKLAVEIAWRIDAQTALQQADRVVVELGVKHGQLLNECDAAGSVCNCEGTMAGSHDTSCPAFHRRPTESTVARLTAQLTASERAREQAESALLSVLAPSTLECAAHMLRACADQMQRLAVGYGSEQMQAIATRLDDGAGIVRIGLGLSAAQARETTTRSTLEYRCDSCGYVDHVSADTHGVRTCSRTNCNGTQSPTRPATDPDWPDRVG